MKIGSALDRFLQQLDADGRSPHTIAQYRRHVRLLARWAADVGPSDAIDALTHEDVARFLSSPLARTRRDGGVKKATSVNCLRSSLRAFFGYLHQAGTVPKNPAHLVRRAICSPPPPRGLSDRARAQLLSTLAAAQGSVARRDDVLFRFMLATGIRVGSVVGIDVQDVDLSRGEVLLRQSKRGQMPPQRLER